MSKFWPVSSFSSWGVSSFLCCQSVSLPTWRGNGAEKLRGKWKRGEKFRNPRCCAHGRNTVACWCLRKAWQGMVRRERGGIVWVRVVRQGTGGGFQPAFYITISHLFARIIWKVSRRLAEGSSFSRNSTCLQKQQGGQ